MASRVMPLRALAGVGVLAASLGFGLMSPVAASAPAAPVSAPAPVVRTTTSTAAATATSTLALPVLVKGEPAATRAKAVSYSLRGVFKSAYVGSFYDKRYEKKRMCIVKRESNGYYTVVSRGGYYGAYQFGDGWRKGAASLMYRSLKKEVGAANALRLVNALKAKHINKWSRYWQDRAFWTVFNHGRGAGNWAGGRWSC
jgi:hypothetical protein